MEKIVNEDVAAELLRLSPRTLQGLRAAGRGPCFVRFGKAVRYRVCDLESYVATKVVKTREDNYAVTA